MYISRLEAIESSPLTTKVHTGQVTSWLDVKWMS